MISQCVSLHGSCLQVQSATMSGLQVSPEMAARTSPNFVRCGQPMVDPHGPRERLVPPPHTDARPQPSPPAPHAEAWKAAPPAAPRADSWKAPPPEWALQHSGGPPPASNAQLQCPQQPPPAERRAADSGGTREHAVQQPPPVERCVEPAAQPAPQQPPTLPTPQVVAGLPASLAMGCPLSPVPQPSCPPPTPYHLLRRSLPTAASSICRNCGQPGAVKFCAQCEEWMCQVPPCARCTCMHVEDHWTNVAPVSQRLDMYCPYRERYDVPWESVLRYSTE